MSAPDAHPGYTAPPGTATGAEGATVHVASRSQHGLDRLRPTVGDDARVHTAVVDATDEIAVTAYVEAVVEHDGHLDVSVCLVSYGDAQMTPLVRWPSTTCYARRGPG